MQPRLHPGTAVGRVNGHGVTQACGATGRKCVSGTGWLQPRSHTQSPHQGPTTTGTTEPRGRTVPRCRLHKGRPVAAGRELGKKYLQWEESKYHDRDILIAGWRLLFIFFNPFFFFFFSPCPLF